MLLAAAFLQVGCSSQSGGKAADYTVIGAQGVYDETDSRVYMEKPIFQDLSTDGIHDPEGQEITSLQEPAVAMQNFPVDRRGMVNWAKAIDDGVIDPRHSRTGEGEMNIMDLDIMLKNTGQMPWVRFPHLAHTRWLDCSNCHPKVFIPQRGANSINMDAIIGGQYCGVCHDKVAFALWTCERCHSVPHEGSPQAWWRDKDKPMPVVEGRGDDSLDVDEL
jgi:c(7)-type cytochrome triheme protein